MQILSLNVDNLDRAQIRHKLLCTWEVEPPGSGEYRYNVEECSDGSKIYLLRPANLNKGCDFAIVSENFKKWKNGNDRAPKHDDVFNLISTILQEDGALKNEFSEAVERTFNCENINEVLADYPRLLSVQNCKAERALKLLKWLWIEQDITYWTGDGRHMLKNAIDELLNSL